MASPKFRASCMNELKDRRQCGGHEYQVLQLRRDVPNDGTTEDEMLVRKKVLEGMMHDRSLTRRSGTAYE